MLGSGVWRGVKGSPPCGRCMLAAVWTVDNTERWCDAYVWGDGCASSLQDFLNEFGALIWCRTFDWATHDGNRTPVFLEKYNPLHFIFESSFRCERQPFDPHNPPSPPFLALCGVRILHRVSFAQTAPGSTAYSCGFLLPNLSSVAWENWCAFAPILPPNGAGAKASDSRAQHAGCSEGRAGIARVGGARVASVRNGGCRQQETPKFILANSSVSVWEELWGEDEQSLAVGWRGVVPGTGGGWCT